MSVIMQDTKASKQRFLELYSAPEGAGNVTLVCSAVPMSRSQFYKWLEVDEEFRQAFMELKLQKCDEAEQELYRRGLEKDTTALIYWLKNNHPNYKERPVFNQYNQFNGDINLGIEDDGKLL